MAIFGSIAVKLNVIGCRKEHICSCVRSWAFFQQSATKLYIDFAKVFKVLVPNTNEWGKGNLIEGKNLHRQLQVVLRSWIRYILRHFGNYLFISSSK